MSVKDKLLSQRGKRTYKAVDIVIDGEPVTFWLRSMNATERSDFEASVLVETGRGKNKTRKTDLKQLRQRLVIASVCAGDGDPTPVFTDADYDALGEVPADQLEKLFGVAMELAGMNDDDVSELAGN